MSLYKLAIVALRLMSVWWFCTAVLSVVSLVCFVLRSRYPEDGSAAVSRPFIMDELAAAAMPSALALAAILLFLFAPWLARRICGDLKPETSPNPIATLGAGDAYRIGSFLMGLYVLVQAISQVVQGTVRMARHAYLSTDTVAPFVEAVILAAFGIALVFGARGLARFLDSLGYDPQDVPAHQFSLRFLLLLVVVCAVIVFIIRSLAD